MKTVDNILRGMRRIADEEERGDCYDLRGLGTDSLRSYADLIEEAMKREREATRDKSSQVGNAAAMREALYKFNAVDLSWLEFPLDGDSSTIYNSNKKEITIPYWRVAELLNVVKEAQDMAKAALAKPPRNCDVGTSEEQAERFYAFCGYHRFQSGIKGMCSSLCPCIRCRDMCNCITTWAQMQYDEVAK